MRVKIDFFVYEWKGDKTLNVAPRVKVGASVVVPPFQEKHFIFYTTEQLRGQYFSDNDKTPEAWVILTMYSNIQ